MKKLLLLIFAAAFVACSNSSSGTAVDSATRKVDTLKVALILPMNEEVSLHWERTVDLFQRNLEKAFAISSLDTIFVLDVEWIDEDKADMDSVGRALASRTKDISAIIGPYYAKDVDIVASYCARAQVKKALISPMATSAEIVRKYGKERWFYSLTETDITQSEMLLQQAFADGAKQVSLLADSTIYTATFLDWFAFQATEMGLKVGEVYVYEGESEIDAVAKRAFENESDYVVCIPDNYKDIPRYLEARRQTKSKARMLLGNVGHDKNVLKMENVEGLEGYAVGSNPESGFETAYQTKFGDFPISGEAQLYDALLLSAFAQVQLQGKPSARFFEMFASESGDDGSEFLAWEPPAMARVFEGILNSESINISGASGNLNFSMSDGAIVNQSVYVHWVISQGMFVPLEYISSSGSKRIVKSKSSINWMASNYDKDFDSSSVFHYPEVEDNYALLVAGSTGWNNYRHQADVLKFYNKLKSLGMDDDHIVLVIEDDLVNSEKNPYPGQLFDYEDMSIYENVEIDYRTSEIVPEDLISILGGERRGGLDKVIRSDSSTNILVFWSGHGMVGAMKWGADSLDRKFSYGTMTELLRKMSAEKKFRKMLWLVETCYSGSVCKAFDDVAARGSMCISAANEHETSKADLYNNAMGTFMTNSFTRNLMTSIDSVRREGMPSVSMMDLYVYAVKHTIGSHVSPYNSANFDNLYTSGIDEFLFPAKNGGL
ncbi:C13 family peptidase [Fibrobacter sp.]|uniref:C13 family peptidase n=1 Tax=Fibrobacter sp. TaxID=35828 RepID=UPI00388F01A1